MSFSQRKKYFSDPYLSPRNKDDLIEVGLLPDIPDLYDTKDNDFFSQPNHLDMATKFLIKKGKVISKSADGKSFETLNKNKFVDGILVSHAHEDHFRYIGFVKGTNVYCSSETAKLINGLRESGIENFETNIHDINIVAKDAPFLIKNFYITPLEVNHSAHGSSAYIIKTSIGNIVYTGDFRIGKETIRFIEEAKKSRPKILICEGTNIGNNKEGYSTEEEVKNKIEEIIKNSKGLVFVDFSFKNLERFFNIFKLSNKLNKKFAIPIKFIYILSKLLSVDSKQLAYKLLSEPSLKNLHIYYRKKDRYFSWEKEIIQSLLLNVTERLINASNLTEDIQNEFILMFSFFDLKYLPDIKPKNAIYIKSNCEPFNEEMEIEEQVLYNWLDKYNIKKECAHTSGHVNFDELKEVIKQINPEIVIPVHTERADLFKSEIEKLGFKVILPKIGEDCLNEINEKKTIHRYTSFMFFDIIFNDNLNKNYIDKGDNK